ncbi:MAG: hypothetical protein ACI8XC_004062 [Gammaproteobacteria bacterium]|jgi:hypothetical protein
MVLTSMSSGFLIAIEIKNIFDDKLIASKTIACEGCNNFEVIRELNKMTFSLKNDNASASVAIELPVVDKDSVVPIEDENFDSSATEMLFWESVNNSNSAEMYQAYLDQYPNGIYRRIATIKLSSDGGSLESMLAADLTETSEMSFWGQVLESGIIESYKLYLVKYPRGKYVQLAKNEIELLEIDGSDFSGTYKSEINYTVIASDEFLSPRWHFGKRPKIYVSLIEDGRGISGSISGDRVGTIKGERNGDKINFDWYFLLPTGDNHYGKGVWIFYKSLNKLVGTWETTSRGGGTDGNWDLELVKLIPNPR